MTVSQVVDKGVTLYTAGTPNGWKVSILLKELNYPHQVRHISLGNNEQKAEWFLKINPNGRIPAIVDHDNDDFAVFESGAIMLYLAEKAGKLLPQDFNKKYEVIQWLMFQMAGIGPMQGQANHFIRYAKEDVEYGKRRYFDETMRLYGILEKRLTGREYIAAEMYSIADIATYAWVVAAPMCGVDLNDFPNLHAWTKKISTRPVVQHGLDVPEPFPIRDIMSDTSKMAEHLKDVNKWRTQSGEQGERSQGEERTQSGEQGNALRKELQNEPQRQEQPLVPHPQEVQTQVQPGPLEQLQEAQQLV